MAKTFLCSKTEPIVGTKAGKLRGFQLDGTYTFHGIQYACADRFQAPKQVAPWDGVKDALSYGPVCPLMEQDTPNGELLVPYRYWPFSEHCQFLNIWTHSLDPAAKKPVMVWLHGGGFSAGSFIEQQCYDGDSLSTFGDVVVVTLNHRLNILGYLDLFPFGEKYQNSGNAGNADIVAALEWIRDNIAGFGGDPDNVTLFGQSGGGMKVWTLMQTPAADGLFHKGIVQSGVIDGIIDTTKADGTKIVNAMLQELGYGPGDVEKLETTPYPALVEAYQRAAAGLPGEYVGNAPMPGDYYLGDPLAVGFTEHAKTIPVMIGSVFGEFSFLPALSNEEKADPDYVRQRLSKHYGEHADQLSDLFRKAYPDKHPSDLLFIDSIFRAPSIRFLQEKAAHPQAPSYSYLFTYTFPYDDGHVAWHCSELPYVFHNAEMVAVCNEPGVSDRLEAQLAGAWVSFARTGDLSCEALPQWPASTAEEEQVMIFDRTCEVRCNFDHELIALHKKAAPPFRFGEVEIQH